MSSHRRHARAALTALCCAAACPVASAFAWSNPVLFAGADPTNGTLRDPCIVADNGTYYLTYTHYNFEGCDVAPCVGSPGIQLWSSPDLATWTPTTWLLRFDSLPDTVPYKGRFWAPELHRIRGQWFLIFTGDNYVDARFAPTGRNGLYAFVGVADRIEGPYENVTWIQGGACDSTLYWDEVADEVYIVMPFGDIFSATIDLRPGATFGNITSPRTLVLSHNYSDIGRPSPLYLEGPFVIPAGGDRGPNVILLAAANYNATETGFGYETVAAYGTLGAAPAPFAKDPTAPLFWGGHLTAFAGPCGASWFAYREEEWAQDAGRLAVDPFNVVGGRVLPRGPPSLGPQAC